MAERFTLVFRSLSNMWFVVPTGTDLSLPVTNYVWRGENEDDAREALAKYNAAYKEE